MKRPVLNLLLVIVTASVQAQNPYLPLWEHLPDGEPRVFEDPDQPGKYRAYIIGSHDITYSAYCGNDIRMWSAPVEDLTQWRDEGPIFSWFVDGRWDTMFAPDLVEVTNALTTSNTLARLARISIFVPPTLTCFSTSSKAISAFGSRC